MRIVGNLLSFKRRFVAETKGNVAMMFGLILPVLMMLVLGGVDLHREASVKSNLQDALDAATLAAARSTATTDADLTTIGLAVLQANMAGYPNVTLKTANTTFRLTGDQVVVADTTADVKAIIANVVLPPYGRLLDDQLPVTVHSEVTRSSKNIEVGLVLDITGSMLGQRLTDLKAAANQLVDIVVQPIQTPYTTRMAIIPYSIGVNLGSYANGARGTPLGSKSITGISWQSGAAININNITRASPGVVTSSGNHGLSTGDYIWISGVSGMTQINDRVYRVVKISNTTFSLQAWNGSSWAQVNTTFLNGYSAYSASGSDTARKCQLSDCSLVVTAASHGIPATTTDQGSTQPGTVYISGVSGLTELNARGFEIANVTLNTFSLVGTFGPTMNAYTSGGSVWGGQDGSQWRVFRRWSDNALTAVQTTTCVSERTGGQAYTEASPSSYPVGRNYAAANNPCPTATIRPLTANTSNLKSTINSLEAAGSTAGQIGLAWGWYSVSPNFNSLLGGAANPYSATQTIKAVIMMTDGDFNSPYCTGVLARDAGAGSGSADDKINCDATNGDPFDQATSLCNAMKAQGVMIYTVGFQVTPNSPAASILQNCASGADHAFLPASGADLKENFAAIGRDITRIRISR